MGCCQSGHTADKELIGSSSDPSKQQVVSDNIKEMQSQQQLYSSAKHNEVNSKIDGSAANNNNNNIAASNQESRLPNSKKISGSSAAGQDKLGRSNHNAETQPDGKDDDKVQMQVSQDINHEDSDENDQDSEQEDQVNDIIDNLIKQNITSMNN